MAHVSKTLILLLARVYSSNMFKKPPNWKKILNNPKDLAILVTSEHLQALVKKANAEYLHWDKFRYQALPNGIAPEAAWALVKIARLTNRENINVKDEYGNPFSIFLTKEHMKCLSFIDSYTSGTIVTGESMPDETSKERLVINGLIEEAISSSQIEGANTTRKVAKNMIEQHLKPKNKSEQMIFNNYLTMSQLEDWKERDLTDDFLLELHKILTSDTLDQKEDEGRFRNDDDEVVVVENPTGTIAHVPPKIKQAREQLIQLYTFINIDDEENYVHPFVKASILHFLIGYIHPFVDGNGRLARALFYWYLLKKDYWMFKFLPISLQIKKQDWKPGYYRAFKYVESDESDITYFLSYKLRLAKNAIEDFIAYLKKKQKEANLLKEKLVISHEINGRQIDLITLLQKSPDLEVDLQTYKHRHHVAYETARVDLITLEDKSILRKFKKGKKYVFIRGAKFPSDKAD